MVLNLVAQGRADAVAVDAKIVMAIRFKETKASRKQPDFAKRITAAARRNIPSPGEWRFFRGAAHR
jgi:hypothetical protein